MKYMVFGMALAVGVPVMAAAAIYSERIKGWLVSLLVFSTVLGDRGGINFWSMEDYRGPDRGFEITITDLVVLSLALTLIVRSARRIKWLPYNTFWMIAFFGLAVLSASKSPEPILSAFTLFKMFKSYLLFWCVVNCIRTGVPLKTVWRGLLAIAVVLVFETLRQKYLMGIYRVHGTFDHSNALAMYVNQITGFLLALGLADRTLSMRLSAVTVTAALGLFFTVVMTFSRAAMVLGGFCIVGLLAYANLRVRNTRVALATLVVMGGVVVGGGMSAGSIINRFLDAPEASADARDEFNLAANLMLRDHPIGVGINQYPYVLTNTKTYRDHIKTMAAEKQAGVCHHIYWLTAAETGWAGLAVFLIILLRFAWRALWYAWRSPGRDGLLQAALFLGMMATHTSGLLEWVFRITPFFNIFLICCGLSVGLAELEKRRRKELGAPSGSL